MEVGLCHQAEQEARGEHIEGDSTESRRRRSGEEFTRPTM